MRIDKSYAAMVPGYCMHQKQVSLHKALIACCLLQTQSNAEMNYWRPVYFSNGGIKLPDV
jgi:hypothetical protein